MHKETTGFFDNTTPKLAYFFGLVTGLAAVSFVGLLILLVGRTTSGDAAIAVEARIPTPSAAAAPAPQPVAQPEPVVGDIAPVTDADHIRGDKNAALTLIEYSDLECPFCKQFHTTVKDTLAKYDGEVRWVYRHFPLRSLHQKAAREAEASECVAELGGNDAFWKFIDRVFVTTQGNDSLPDSELPNIAVASGVNKDKFTACLDSGRNAAKVQANEQDAVTAGGQGTPYSILMTSDGQLIPVNGAVPAFQLEQMIDSVLSN